MGNVLEDASVGGKFAADVVILGQAVDGDGYVDDGELGPGGGRTALVTIIVEMPRWLRMGGTRASSRGRIIYSQ